MNARTFEKVFDPFSYYNSNLDGGINIIYNYLN